MIELLREAFAPPNLLYTLLLGLVMIYWLTVLLGALDLDFLDLDLEVDADVDLDVDVDVDVDTDIDMENDVSAGGGGGHGWFLNVATFFNLGSVPFMIFISVLILSMWALSMIGNYYLGQGREWFFLAFLIPNLLGSLFITKVLTMPLKGMYKKMNQQGVSKRDLIGKVCKVTLSISPGETGQAEINYDDQNFLLKVQIHGETAIAKGEQALIVGFDQEKNVYLISGL